MFATHYHELTELENHYNNIQNLSVAVSENGNNIIFLHNIVFGPASKSYGIHVAKIAGVPDDIRERAIAKLNELEENENICNTDDSLLKYKDKSINVESNNDAYERICKEILNIDVNTITPIQSINRLQDIIEKIKILRSNND